MNITFQPIDEVEGIGPKTAASLHKANLHYVADLLLRSPNYIHSWVKQTNSLRNRAGVSNLVSKGIRQVN